jgi:hypothetical protein
VRRETGVLPDPRRKKESYTSAPREAVALSQHLWALSSQDHYPDCPAPALLVLLNQDALQGATLLKDLAK